MATSYESIRKNVRANLHIGVVLTGASRDGRPFSISGQSLDFSRGGLGVLVDRDVLKTGSVVSVTSAGFQSSATVQWSTRDKESGKYRVGLRLVKPRVTTRLRMVAALLLMGAFMKQISSASPREYVRQTPVSRSGSSATAKTSSSPPARSEVSSSERRELLTQSDAADLDVDEGSWIQEALAISRENRHTAGRAALNIEMSKENYAVGETISAREYRVSNPSEHSRSVEIKTWLAAPGISPISIGNVGADGSYILTPGSSQNFGPVEVLSIPDEMPGGIYKFSARMIDPVTGDILEEKIKPFSLLTRMEKSSAQEPGSEVPLLDVQFNFSNALYTYGETVSLEQFRIENMASSVATIELKLWLEIPDKDPVPVYSMGADGSFILTPGAEMNLKPFVSFKVTEDLPAGEYRLRCRAMNPATGQTFYENASSFRIQ